MQGKQYVQVAPSPCHSAGYEASCAATQRDMIMELVELISHVAQLSTILHPGDDFLYSMRMIPQIVKLENAPTAAD